MEGDTISVNCSYDPRQWWREKSWCRQLDESRCQHVVSAPTLWLPFSRSRRGTTSIRDNTRAGLLTITMRRLQKEDAGLYQCRTDFLGETRSLRKVQVEVLAGRSWGSELEGSYWNFTGSFLEFHGFLFGISWVPTGISKVPTGISWVSAAAQGPLESTSTFVSL